jgi:nucleotide-binding universal stress UspA family protein
MKTILVPTDYSAVAQNAAIFAFNLASKIGAVKIVFYNSYQAQPVLTETAAPAMRIMDIETIKNISNEGMTHFINAVKPHCPPGIVIEQRAEYGIVADDIEEICKNTGAELIVMGITGASKVEEVLVGNTATTLVRHTKVPVVIVPADARSTELKNLTLATDLKKVEETTPVQQLKDFLLLTGAQLHILHIEEGNKEQIAGKTYQKERLNVLLGEYNPQFHTVSNPDFTTGINEFVRTNSIDMIITIPRKHSFFQRLFNESHSKKIAFHSHVPIMCLHLEDL